MKLTHTYRRAILAYLPFLFTVCIAPIALGQGQSARVIAVQPKVDLAYCDTYAHYRQHMMDLVHAQVTPRLSTGRPNLIVFPEDVGLPAAFIGSRGAHARTQSTVFNAYLSLIVGDPPPYGLALFYYSTV